MQIVLYVGGIMVLFLFVIMLVNLDEAAHERQFNRQWVVALAAVLAVGAEIGYFLYRGQGAFHVWPKARLRRPRHSGNTEMLGGHAVFRVSAAFRDRLRCCCWWRWSAR